MSSYDYDVFLSFASLNASMAKTLYNQLTRSGLRVFWSDEVLKKRVGKSWIQEIEKALKASTHLVLLWTDEAEESYWVNLEYNGFHIESMDSSERLLVPVLGTGKEADSLPLFLRQLQTYPFNGDLEHLITSLGGHYVPLEQENERLRKELELVKTQYEELQHAQSKGTANKAEVRKLQSELKTLEQRYAGLENQFADLSVRQQDEQKKAEDTLAEMIENYESQLDELRTEVKRYEQELAALKKNRTQLLATIAEKEDAISLLKKRSVSSEKEPKPKKTPVISVNAFPDTYTDDHGIEFVLIEPGRFKMGSEEGHADERPVHPVEITQPFYLGKYAVTQAQWQAIQGQNPSQFGGPQHPVEQVSWNDVQRFLQKINRGEELYRLPTEAEWEYACRAGTSTKYSFGDSIDVLKGYAWYSSNSEGKTHPVGQMQPNPWGLYDMHGNVWEWVEDRYAEDYYKLGESKAMVDPQGAASGTHRAFRGGGWISGAESLRSTKRNYGTPGTEDNRIGFRILKMIV